MRLVAIGLRGIPDVMGGIETHCEHLYPRLAKLDDDLEIVVIGRSGYSHSGRFGKVRVVTLWAPHRRALETLVHTPLAILYARLFLHPKVIHLHGIGPGFFAPLARLLGFRVVGTHHAVDYERPKWGKAGRLFLKTGERLLAWFADDVICVSNAIETSLSARYPNVKRRVVTIRNGAPPVSAKRSSVDPLAALGLAPKQYVLAVGRIDPTKGFHDLVRAFGLARPKGMKLVVAGGAPMNDPYADELVKAASSDIIFVGVQTGDRLRSLYENAALFVHPSCTEGFPIVVLEALAADVPILVTDIPAHREVGLDRTAFFATGDVRTLTRRLSEGGYDRFRCARRMEILRDNDWDAVARKHHEIIVRHARGRPTAAAAGTQAPASDGAAAP
jgi:glycosyltransferase involved in cell wall biosynthesis